MPPARHLFAHQQQLANNVLVPRMVLSGQMIIEERSTAVIYLASDKVI